ncbi:hypothetical protein CI238_12140 [Colletotrichum incanum]|uniref:Uncharacterized protein n=1 Tax=Colletotrichum incanum TaxID=1573173 RepID=A0A166T4I9_COLIC|nr:hypothetical protein CI238_12140 [Colletotrichum incanum]
MRRLRHFLQRKDRKYRKEDSADASTPPLPFLPPWPSRASWEPVTQTQGIFRLPLELRHKILCEAFGNKTIHIDLRIASSSSPTQSAGGGHPRHGRSPPLIEPSSRPSHDGNPCSNKMTWRWYSCVCHRNAPSVEGFQFEPHTDKCLRGEAKCDAWLGAFPDKCHVGAMGFLLSCKQGHDELCDILFSTNTFFIESQPLIDALLRQGLPESPRITGAGMQMLISLQMRWVFTLFGTIDGSSEDSQRGRFIQNLDLLPRAFPKLSQLHLIFDGPLYNKRTNPVSNLEEIETILLKPLEALSKKVSDTLVAAMPTSLFDAFRRVAPPTPEEDKAIFKARGIWGLRVWYPFMAMEEDRGKPGKGLWIKSGPENSLDWRRDGSSFLHSHSPASVPG